MQSVISWANNIIDGVQIEFILSKVARASTFFQFNQPQICIIVQLFNPKIQVESRSVIDAEGIFVNFSPFLKNSP